MRPTVDRFQGRYQLLQASTAEAAIRALEELCRAELAPYKRPKTIRVASDLPKTATGKIQKLQVVRDLVAAACGEAPPPEYVVPVDRAELEAQRDRMLR